MSKQVHVRMDDSLYEALSEYTGATGQSVQDCISIAIMQMLGRQKSEQPSHNADFTFIDLFAGIGGMRIAFEQAGGHCVYSNEWNKYSQQTYFANFGTTLDASQPVHPCFLYESLWCLLGFVLLAIFAKKIRRYDGQIFLIYICWYGAERAVVESLRTDSLVIGNVRVSQILAITCVVISIIL